MEIYQKKFERKYNENNGIFLCKETDSLEADELPITYEEEKHSVNGFVKCLWIKMNNRAYTLRMVDKRITKRGNKLLYNGDIYLPNGEILDLI